MSSASSPPLLVYGRSGEHRIPLSAGRYLIGRAFNSDIRLDDIHVSRAHAALDVREGGVWLEDLGSSGGTLVNSEELTTPREIHSSGSRSAPSTSGCRAGTTTRQRPPYPPRPTARSAMRSAASRPA